MSALPDSPPPAASGPAEQSLPNGPTLGPTPGPTPGPTQAQTQAENAELLRLVFEHAGEGISVFDAQLRLRAWNTRFLQLTGIDPALAHRGAALFDLLLQQAVAGEFGPLDAHAEAQRRLDSLRDGDIPLTQRLRPNGRSIETRRSGLPGGGFVMLCVDITERRASEALALAEQRMLALLMTRTEQGFWFIDNNLLTTHANPAMCRMLGLPLAQVLGRNIYAFVDEANAALYREQVTLRQQGQAAGYEISLRRADGSLLRCFNNATPLFDASGQPLGAVGMYSDISRLTRAEQQLRRTGALLAQKSQVLENTLESLSQGVLSLDTAGRANAWNQRLLDLLHVPRELMLGRPSLTDLAQFQDAHGPITEGHAEIENQIETPAKAAAAGWIGVDPQALLPVYQRTGADGKVLEVRTQVAVDKSVVRTYTDVTANVLAERALRDSETRFRTMANAAPALIWQSDATGTPSWFNQRWLDHTGRSMAEELRLPWASRIHGDDQARCRVLLESATTARLPYSVEFRLLKPAGNTVWIADSGIPHFGPDGRFEGYIGYGWEISQRKAAEVALIAAKEEAERANRAKSEFLSRMSHELRTPLNAVLGFGQLLESDAVDRLSPGQRSRVQELLRGGRHLLSLINDVLDLARIDAGTLQLRLAPVDLAALAGDCLRLVQPMADERGIRLQVSSAPLDAPAVLADPTRLKQVLLNLLSNAIKYNHEGGRVELRWHAVAAGRQVCIEVIDNGPGLSAAQQTRLFQAFERLDAERTSVEGAGIGLALSKWLMNLMRGEIGVRSAPGQGCTFWLQLACADAARLPPLGVANSVANSVATAAPTGPPAAALAQATRQVLYIEDNSVNQLLMQGMLMQRPAIVLRLAELPEAGLLMAVESVPDLILLDIQLPQMDGFEVLRRLRQNPLTQAVPVVAVSANALHSDIEKAHLAGFADYITKPLDLTRLLAVVDRCLSDGLAPSPSPSPGPGRESG